MPGRVWNYISTNPLISAVLALIIFSAGGAIWASLASWGSHWFWANADISRGGAVILALVMLAELVAIRILWNVLRHAKALLASRPEMNPKGQLQGSTRAPERMETAAPTNFEPEKFELTPPRCRALVGLLQRVDARTTLHDLYTLVAQVGPFRDMLTTKAKVQQDMEEAEQAGLVLIDRVGELTAYYNLTIPAGRKWVLSKEMDLRAKAAEGMQRVNPRYF